MPVRPFRARLVFALLLGLALSPSETTGGVREWTNTGPFGGAPRKVAFHPVDADVVYAIGRAGFYVSTDRAATWHLARANSHGEQITGVVVSEHPPYTVYLSVGTGWFNGLLLALNPDLTCCARPPYPTYGGELVLVRGAPEFVYVASTSGEAVRLSSLTFPGSRHNIRLPFKPSYLESSADAGGYMFAVDRSGNSTTYRSADRGLTWSVLPVPMRPDAIRHAGDGVVYLTGLGAGGICGEPGNSLFQSWDFGSTWHLANIGLSENDRDCFASTSWIECVRSGPCYLRGDGKVFSRGWSEIRWVQRPDLQAERIWVRSDGSVLLGNRDGALARYDTNAWQPASYGLREIALSELLVDGAGQLRFAGSRLAGRLYERLAGAWEEVPFRIHSDAFPSMSGDTGVVRRSQGDWVAREPGSSQWTAIPGTANMIALVRNSSGMWIGMSQEENKYRLQTLAPATTTWKTAWQLTTPSVSTYTACSIHPDPFSTQHLLLRFEENILESRDGGKTWVTILEDASWITQLQIDWSGGNVYMTDLSKLYVRPLAGGEWRRIASDATNIALEEESHALYMSTPTRGIVRSVDAGTTWATVDPRVVTTNALVRTSSGLAAALDTGVHEYEFAVRRRAVRK